MKFQSADVGLGNDNRKTGCRPAPPARRAAPSPRPASPTGARLQRGLATVVLALSSRRPVLGYVSCPPRACSPVPQPLAEPRVCGGREVSPPEHKGKQNHRGPRRPCPPETQRRARHSGCVCVCLPLLVVAGVGSSSFSS